MDRSSRNLGPLIVGILVLLLPVMYVGSYLVLIVPGGYHQEHSGPGYYYFTWECYRYGGAWSDNVFWPLHQIDRTIRPDTWE